MSRFVHIGAAVAAIGIWGFSSAQAATVTVDPAATWLGFMNVFELPSNGGGFVFGSGWGTPDLCATFTGSTLRLSPNTIGDPNPFWYTPSGGPGSQGNKIMDANMYVEPAAGTLSGQAVTFNGSILSNTPTSAHDLVAFVKDFAPDYSSSVSAVVPITSGSFSVTLNTIADPARHVQYGFEMKGVNVWVTDVAPFGAAEVSALVPEPTSLAALGALTLVRRRR